MERAVREGDTGLHHTASTLRVSAESAAEANLGRRPDPLVRWIRKVRERFAGHGLRRYPPDSAIAQPGELRRVRGRTVIMPRLPGISTPSG
jgi:hypothetical protein